MNLHDIQVSSEDLDIIARALKFYRINADYDDILEQQGEDEEVAEYDIIGSFEEEVGQTLKNISSQVDAWHYTVGNESLTKIKTKLVQG